ncbi:dephospho-CoA kinase [Paenibacillus sp. FSL R5-0636]|jgi:dephospho-CoA kinase|uniref:Dephospho-CoA kinase n=1 Tax=Paenibacillus odorifer TaxID=189426 RepID=A0ABX3GJI3_9BACL|nr:MULTISPECIES: dephospho-CoA kinase [Paenibacillus]MDH6426300.1 dephospho-CoA kinase [Paenibacillus sp. PastH-4]MDH6442323.1 dephospho-CoA kinase [Paenibacillus sp. PastF-4]MDH6526964.1 dephospho-CoA kinase [Paenibacillus sp. PastH-3]OMC75470.1 dephospho-CoA kinase [Paenibacillus odorifer]OMC77892.1 dephospho-CoA kinase [Paenibacillus odorifer]
MIIGLTGGIASGKSTVSALLVNKGARLVDADVIAREVMLPGHEVLAAAAKQFGKEILFPDGTLNRAKLGEIVFQDPVALQTLNNLTHPAIRQEIKDRMYSMEQEEPKRLIIVDIPLLFESGLETLFHEIVVVYVPREMQIARLMERNRLSLEEAEARLNAQMDIEQKRNKADYIIDNSGDLAYTEQQVAVFWDRLGLS